MYENIDNYFFLYNSCTFLNDLLHLIILKLILYRSGIYSLYFCVRLILTLNFTEFVLRIAMPYICPKDLLSMALFKFYDLKLIRVNNYFVFFKLFPILKFKSLHCLKSIQIRSFFWSLFSRIQTEYEKIRTRKNFVFGHFSRSVG